MKQKVDCKLSMRYIYIMLWKYYDLENTNLDEKIIRPFQMEMEMYNCYVEVERNDSELM